MAFSTIQGSGGAPDSFVGTSGVDSIALNTQQGSFFLGAQGANDNIAFTAPAVAPVSVSGSTLRGGAGSDAFIATGFTTTFSGVFFNGNAGGDTYNFTRSNVMSGSTLQGGQGADAINTGAANFSLINGNRDNDTITVDGAVISSSLFGGQGTDTITISAATTNSTVDGADGADTINSTFGALTGSTLLGSAGNDSINIAAANTGAIIDSGADNDTVTGNAAADTITAGAGNDNVAAGGGSDTITTGDGNDAVNGDGGNDNITGGDGNDTITGGAGNDQMNAGTGTNTFGNSSNFGAAGSSTAATANNLTAGGIVAGEFLTFNGGVDQITAFQAPTDLLDVVTAGAVGTNLVGTAVAESNVAGTTFFSYGTWNANNNTFTLGAAGAYNAATARDLLVYVGDGVLTATNQTGYQVITNLSQAIAAAQFV